MPTDGDLVSDLRQKVAAGQALLVVGSGVSVASSPGVRTLSWDGLIRHGIEFARNLTPALSEGWQRSVEGDLDLARSDGLPDLYVSAAQKVSSALGGPTAPDYRDWLATALGDVRPTESGILKALDELNLGVLTTNYDSLIERGTGRDGVTWQEIVTRADALRPASRTVVHLHGSWDKPDSVIFGHDSYSRMLNSEASQLLQRAVALASSLIFVGCGDGLADPNFASMRQWLREHASNSGYRHFVVCRDSERQRLADQFAGERLYAVSYGEAYQELPGFLSQLRPVSIELAERVRKQAEAPAVAVKELSDRVRREAVLGQHMANLEERNALEVLIPPVLLPVPHDQFARSRQDSRVVRHERCNPSEDVTNHRYIVVVGDENSGITSALAWMLAQSAQLRPDIVPIMLDWRSLSTGVRPVERQVLRQLWGAGALYDKRSELPQYIVALDNVLAKPHSIFGRMLEDIEKDTCDRVILGCRSGAESEVCAQLDAAGLAYELRYVGRMNSKDVESLAALVAPGRARVLSRRALRMVRTERLPRTPFTLSLLLSALLLGENFLQANTGTALLDAYVNLLLGRGDIHEDARLSIDAKSRASILAHFAKRLAEERQGSLEESAVLDFLVDFFKSRDWSEDASAVLANLKARRVLVSRGSRIGFAQSSYLHLFAAHMAMESPEFREFLLREPIYYSPILRHYGSLTRNDRDTLARLDALLGVDTELPMPGTALFSTTSEKPTASPTSTERLLASLDAPELTSGEGMAGHERPDEDDSDGWDDSDVDPFPLDCIQEAPPAAQLAQVLTLVSTFLRDSDSIVDLSMKHRVLVRLLTRWGVLAETLNGDEDFQTLCTDLLRDLKSEDDLVAEGAPREVAPEDEDSGRDLDAEEFASILATVYSIATMSATLSSRKLMRSIDRLAESEATRADDPRAPLMAAFMAMDVQGPNWPRTVAQLAAHHMRGGLVATFVWRVSLFLYYNQKLGAAEEAQLRKFLVDATIRNRGHKDNPALREDISQKLQLNRRRQARFPKLERGASPFSTEVILSDSKETAEEDTET